MKIPAEYKFTITGYDENVQPILKSFTRDWVKAWSKLHDYINMFPHVSLSSTNNKEILATLSKT